MQKIVLQIEGMTCQSCASRIEKVLNKKPFVQQASVNFATEEAQIEFDESQANTPKIIEIIEKTGFKAQSKNSEKSTALLPHISPRLILLWLINIPFLVGMIGMLFGSHQLMMPPVWQFSLATIVQFALAFPFYRSAWASLRGGLANMDVLVSLGTLTIYFYSVAMWLFVPQHTSNSTPHIYFEASVMVLGFVSLGKFLEERTKKHSLNSLALLLQLTPQNVVVQRDEQWQTIALSQVKIDDVLRANQGERIAADGVVLNGFAWCDESHLTGESVPLAKNVGDKVLAGALVSQGNVVYQAKQLGRQTLLGDMMNALSEAQGTKAPIARFADKVAAIFVPTVIGISLLTFILTCWWNGSVLTAIIHAVAVLVIACPCALGLATPASMMVGMGKAVRSGIWFKDAAAMEETARVNCVVLDKTGTLTEGKPTLVESWFAQESAVDFEKIFAATASLEQQASHPLAQAIVENAQAQNLTIPPVTNVETIVGEGIMGDVIGVGRVKVGKVSFCGLSLPELTNPVWKSATIVAVSIDDKPVAAFALADRLKVDSVQAIQRLQQCGIEVIMMSGDNDNVVRYIAQQLGIQQAFANMSPRDKAYAIQQLQQQGKTVAMVGDGINDAPALAVANVSFAMQNGVDVAQQVASATLMQHSVNQLVDALLIARATLKNIKQNLFFAFVYNVLGIPLAAIGFLSPIIAGAAMALSSISVLSNALRLKRGKI